MNAPHYDWTEFKKWNRLGMLTFFLPVPLSLLLALGLGSMFPEKMLSIILSLIFIFSFLGFAYSYWRIRSFRCPRCKDYFTVATRFSPNTRGRTCVHCGLNLNE